MPRLSHIQNYKARLSKETLQACLDRYDTLLVDFDGVLWSNDMYSRFEWIGASVEKLCELGEQFYFVGNNATHNKITIMKNATICMLWG